MDKERLQELAWESYVNHLNFDLNTRNVNFCITNYKGDVVSIQEATNDGIDKAVEDINYYFMNGITTTQRAIQEVGF